MRKLGFIGSILSVLLGATMLFTTSILNELMPKIARALFTIGTYGSQSALMVQTII